MVQIGQYDIDLEKTAEEVVDEVKEYTNSKLLERYLGPDTDKQAEFVEKLIRAEFYTQYPDLRKADKIGEKLEDEKEFQGCIEIRRAAHDTEGPTGNQEEQVLEYMDYKTFIGLVTSNNKEALNYFTLTGSKEIEKIEEGEIPEEEEAPEETDKQEQAIGIVVAKYNEEFYEITTNDDTINFDEEFNGDKYDVVVNEDGSRTATHSELTLSTTIPFEYQSITDYYTMPFEFLWSLLVLGEDVDLVTDLAELALKSKIIITVQDNLNSQTDTTKYSYQKQVDKDIGINIQKDNSTEQIEESSTFKNPPIILPSGGGKYYKNAVNTKISNNVIMDVTYADTWFLEYKNSYSNKITSNEVILDEVYTKDNREDLADSIEGTEAKTYMETNYSQEKLKEIEQLFIDAGATNEKGQTIPTWKQNMSVKNTSKMTKTQVTNRIAALLNGEYQSISFLLDPKKINAIANLIIDKSGTNYGKDLENLYATWGYEEGTQAYNYISRIDSLVNRVAKEYIDSTKTANFTIKELFVTQKNKHINKQEELRQVVSYNTYTRGEPYVREKTNTYSCYSTIGLDWTKILENDALFDYMNGKSSYNDYVGKYVTKDRKYYINYGEYADDGSLKNTNYAYGCKVDDFIAHDAGDVQKIIYAELKGLQDTTALTDLEQVYSYLTEEKHNYLAVGAKIPVKIIDEAILQEYTVKRLYVETTATENNVVLLDLFTQLQIDVLTDMNYQGALGTSRFNILCDFMRENKDKDLDTEETRNYLKENVFNEGSAIYRDKSRLETFVTGKYTRCDANGNIERVLDEEEYDEKGDDIQRDYNFIILMNEHEAAKTSIISASDMLLGNLEDSPKTEKQIDLIKELLIILNNEEIPEEEKLDWLKIMQSIYTYEPIKIDFNVRTTRTDIEVLDKEKLSTAIETLYKDNEALKNNLLNNLDLFLEMQKNHGVDAAFAIAIAVQETSAGTNMPEILKGTNNWMGVKGVYNNNKSTGCVTQVTSDGEEITWKKYPSVEVAIDDFGKTIKSSYFPRQVNISKISENYAEGNETWADNINNEMKKIYVAAGVNVFGDDIRSLIVTIAESQIGNENGLKYKTWYPLALTEPWCAAFVSWVADQAGVMNTLIPKFASCDDYKWFQNEGRYERSQAWGGNYIPKPGDVIFFDWTSDGQSESECDHTGYVKEVKDGFVITIEGNSSNMCKSNKWSITERQIKGYGVLYYTND